MLRGAPPSDVERGVKNGVWNMERGVEHGVWSVHFTFAGYLNPPQTERIITVRKSPEEMGMCGEVHRVSQQVRTVILNPPSPELCNTKFGAFATSAMSFSHVLVAQSRDKS